MSMLHRIFVNFLSFYGSEAVPTEVILTVLLAVLLLSAYEFAVYRLVSHRTFYNRSFNISIAVLPFFIATIILCLQSNLVITLGTIGALAIIRFRTAVKDPVDMIYLLWSIHTGIVCGCRLFEVAVLTSVVVTIVLLILEFVKIGGNPQMLVVHSKNSIEEELTKVVKENSKRCRVKSRSCSQNGFDYVYELTLKNPAALTDKLNAMGNIERFSILEYDSKDIL